DSRLDVLVLASVLDEIDDPLADAISAGTYTAEALTNGLPMVETHPSGSRRMHALLREVLATRLADPDRVDTLRRAAGVEVERGRLAEACDLLVQAGDREQAVDTARRFVVLPTLRGRMDNTRSVRRSITAVAPDSALCQLLDGHCNLNLPAERLTAMFETIAAVAQQEDDGLIEAVAAFRAIQAANNGHAPLPHAAVERVRRLADDVPFAGAIYAYLESLHHQAAGDADAAVHAMEGCGPLGRETLLALEPERFCDLGRPEMVAADLGPEDLSSLPPGAEIFIAFAMWLRGEASPDAALAIGGAMMPSTLTRGLTQPVISLLAVLTHIALAAGETERAREFATECSARCASQGDVRTALFGAMAMASVSSVDGDEQHAAALLDPAATGVPFGYWPARPHLLGLSLVYLSRPETREVLDRCAFGPALQTAVAAGRALVELREEGSARGASSLPWHDEYILRVHVLPHHLAELAAAAASKSAAWASARVVRVGPEPLHSVQVSALGAIGLLRDGDPVSDPDWVRRVRVRELLALLVECHSMPRGDVAAELWPELNPERATNNLRVTLSRLQGVLEPDRDPNHPPSFVYSEGANLVVGDRLEIDVPAFERLLNRAQGIDRAGGPAEAMGLYEQALVLWRGTYLDSFDNSRVTVTRMRLDSLARTAMVRLGELELARGEPERALRRAASAQSTSALDERAGRLMALAMHAMGDRAGAVAAITALIEALAGAGLEPQPETLSVLERASSSG
ncbi:MAG: BTAD domain-containing putative transcriptional regulator, partial [Acidimicrobiales bacterium]